MGGTVHFPPFLKFWLVELYRSRTVQVSWIPKFSISNMLLFSWNFHPSLSVLIFSSLFLIPTYGTLIGLTFVCIMYLSLGLGYLLEPFLSFPANNEKHLYLFQSLLCCFVAISPYIVGTSSGLNILFVSVCFLIEGLHFWPNKRLFDCKNGVFEISDFSLLGILTSDNIKTLCSDERSIFLYIEVLAKFFSISAAFLLDPMNSCATAFCMTLIYSLVVFGFSFVRFSFVSYDCCKSSSKSTLCSPLFTSDKLLIYMHQCFQFVYVYYFCSIFLTKSIQFANNIWIPVFCWIPSIVFVFSPTLPFFSQISVFCKSIFPSVFSIYVFFESEYYVFRCCLLCILEFLFLCFVIHDPKSVSWTVLFLFSFLLASTNQAIFYLPLPPENTVLSFSNCSSEFADVCVTLDDVQLPSSSNVVV